MLGPPDGLLDALAQLEERISAATARLEGAVVVDALGELALRGRVAGHRRRGEVSCGGATRLLRSGSGWVALTLARPSDLELVPALTSAQSTDDPWTVVADWSGARSSTEVVDRCALLGIACAVLESTPLVAKGAHSPIAAPSGLRLPGRSWRASGRSRPRVVDLSALWAGPLAGQILALAGCDVVKVESTARPDGARGGHPAVFDHLNRSKRSAVFDFHRPTDLAALRQLAESADVVIEASRPRALRQLGLSAGDIASPSVWVTITAHGTTGEAAGRVGFGDDCAVGAGLVAHDALGPVFCADAIADPLTGLLAATLALESLAGGERVHHHVSMSETARWFAGATLPLPRDLRLDGPKPPSRHVPEAAVGVASIGEHTAAVLREWTARDA